MTSLIEAKLKVKKESCYKALNGQIFPVLNFGDKFIDLSIHGISTQFRLNEVELRIYNQYNLDYVFKILKFK